MDVEAAQRPRDQPKFVGALARALAVAAIVAAALAYSYAVRRVAAYAWVRGLHFEQSYLFSVDTLRDGVHLLLLGIGLTLFGRFAGVGLPRFKGIRWALYSYLAVVAAVAAGVAANQVKPFYSSPFAGNGPLFFTLGPLAWELLWPGFVYGFAKAVAGTRTPAAVDRILIAFVTLAGTAWYAPLLRGLNAPETATFLGLAVATSFLGLTLRRRTGSIWPGFAGHVLVWFFLTW